MIHCQQIPHLHLREYLEHTGPAGVFSRYVVRKKPTHTAFAVVDDAKIIGSAVAGRTVGLHEAYSHWIFANTQEAATLLAQALRGQDVSINVPLTYLDTARSIYAGLSSSLDYVYLLSPAQFQPIPHTLDVWSLSSTDLKQLELIAELRPLLGTLDDWQDDLRLYGIVEAGQLVAMAEMSVRDQHIVVLQQLYTITSHRGRQLAQSLISSMVEQIIAQGKTAMYVVAEDNLPSRAIAEKLGFRLDSQWGFISG